MPKVSIILPVYNVEKFLHQSMNSIINQTLQDIEIICIIDGSTDNSPQILEEYAAQDSRIKILNQKNQGQGVARNKGIEIATGEYLGFVDPDDWIELNMFEELYSTAQKYDSDLVETLYSYYYEKNNHIKKYKYKTKLPQNKSFQAKSFPKYIFEESLFPWNKIYKTEMIKSNNVKFDIGRFAEDQIFTIESRLLSKKINFCEKSLYNYRQRIGSSLYQVNPDRKLRIQQIQKIQEFIYNNKFDVNVNKQFEAYKIAALAINYTKLADENKRDFEKEVQGFLSPEQYIEYEKIKNRSNKNFESIFSLKNKFYSGSKYKVLTILGYEIKLKKQF